MGPVCALVGACEAGWDRQIQGPLGLQNRGVKSDGNRRHEV